MASPSDDSFERTRSPPTKLRPPADHRYTQPLTGTRGRTSPSPRRSASPTAPSYGAPAPPRDRHGAPREKGTTRVLAELADLRAQLEAHASTAAARGQELALAQQEVGALRAELERRTARGDPAGLSAEVTRLTQENAMVLEYLDKSMEEIQKHKEANHKLLLLQTDQQRHAQDLQDLVGQREAQVEQERQRGQELARQLAELQRVAEARGAQVEQAEEARRAAEAALEAGHREYADLQTIQDELLDSLQAAQNELHRLQTSPPSHAEGPPPSELARVIQRNTETLQQQQAVMWELVRQFKTAEGPRPSPTAPALTDTTLATSVGDQDRPRAEDRRALCGAASPAPLRPPTTESGAQAQVWTRDAEAQTTAMARDDSESLDLTVARQEIARLELQLEAERQERRAAAAVYERELQHLRVQQELQLVGRVDRQMYESLQRSYELSEARSGLLKASLSLCGGVEDHPDPLTGGPLCVT